jgi:two-component system, cell cycle response regulator DivK
MYRQSDWVVHILCFENCAATARKAFRWQGNCRITSGRTPLKRILLVEDSRFLRVANGRIFAKAGYEVVMAEDGEEALRLAFESVPDLILLDMILPKLGGPEVLRALRQNPRTAAIPVIVLSSLTQKNDAKLMKEGATAYFEKSKLQLDHNSETLLEIVKKTLDGAEAAKRMPSPARPAPPGSIS